MKATFIPILAALAGLAVATPEKAIFKRDAQCDTADASEAPADNDCLEVVSDMAHNRDESEDLAAGEWHSVGCSEQCKISVKPDAGGAIGSEDIMNDVQAVLSKCSIDENNDPIAFKGEITTGGRTTSVFKGGNC